MKSLLFTLLFTSMLCGQAAAREQDKIEVRPMDFFFDFVVMERTQVFVQDVIGFPIEWLPDSYGGSKYIYSYYLVRAPEDSTGLYAVMNVIYLYNKERKNWRVNGVLFTKND